MKSDTFFKLLPWILTVVIGCFAIYDRLTLPSVSLEATVSYNDFSWPGGFKDYFGGLRETLSEDSLKERFNLLEDLVFPDTARKGTKAVIVANVHARFQNSIGNNLPHTIPEPYSKISGQWNMTLRNGTSKEVESVDIVFPSAILAEIKREGGKRELRDIDEIVELGRLRPGEVVSLVAWVHNLTSWEDSDIRVTHKNGTGDVTVLRQKAKSNMSVTVGFVLGVILVIMASVSIKLTYSMMSVQTKRLWDTPKDDDLNPGNDSRPEL